jgi:predicted nucleotidyltransferase
MGTKSRSPDGRGLFGHTRGAILGELYGHPDQSFYLRQLVRALGAGHGSVQRELKRLLDMGLIVRRAQGNQVLYQANARSPVFSEIKSLIAKTVGIHDVIRSALAPLASQIQIAFVYGSIARQTEQATSDVDLMILGDASFGDIVSVLSPAQKTLGREINPTIFSASEFRTKLADGNHFLRTVMGREKLFIFGNEDEFAELAAK